MPRPELTPQTTPAHTAAVTGDVPRMRFLAGCGMGLNVKDKQGNSPLHIAAHKGNLEIVQILLEQSVDVNTYNRKQDTPLFLAVRGKQEAIVKELLTAGADVSMEDATGNTVMHKAAQLQSVEMIKAMLRYFMEVVNVPGHKGATPLHLAVKTGDHNVVELLLEHGGDVQLADNAGWTCMHYAAVAGRVPILRLLLQSGASPDAVTNDGCTPMHLAAQHGHAAAVQFLVDSCMSRSSHPGSTQSAERGTEGPMTVYGTESGVAQRDGDPAEGHRGVDERQGGVGGVATPSAARLRASSWHGTSEREGERETPISEQMHTGSTGRPLVSGSSGSPYGEDYVVGSGAAAQDKLGRCPLHFAAVNGHTSVIRLLLSAGADPHMQDSKGRTCMHVAASTGQSTVLSVVMSGGGDPFVVDNARRTCLHAAARAGQEAVVKLLVSRLGTPAERAQYLNLADIDSNTPLHLAVLSRNPLAVQLLYDAGCDRTVRNLQGMTPVQFAAANAVDVKVMSVCVKYCQDCKSERVAPIPSTLPASDAARISPSPSSQSLPGFGANPSAQLEPSTGTAPPTSAQPAYVSRSGITDEAAAAAGSTTNVQEAAYRISRAAGMSPKCWLVEDKWHQQGLTPDKDGCLTLKPGNGMDAKGSCRVRFTVEDSDRAFEYFEVEVKATSSSASVDVVLAIPGLCWYWGVDGQISEWQDGELMRRPYGPKFGPGDVVGALYCKTSRTLVFTKNGVLLKPGVLDVDTDVRFFEVEASCRAHDACDAPHASSEREGSALDVGYQLRCNNGMVPFAAVVDEVLLQEWQWCLEQRLSFANSQATLLHLAAHQRNPLILSLLLNYTKDTDTSDVEGWTPLHYVAVSDWPEGVDLLLAQSKTVLNSTTNSGSSPLILATQMGGRAVAKRLLRCQEIDVNIADQNKRTAIMFAARNGDAELVEYLMDKGAKVTAMDRTGKTVLEYASDSHVSELIRNRLKKKCVVNGVYEMTIGKSIHREEEGGVVELAKHIDLGCFVVLKFFKDVEARDRSAKFLMKLNSRYVAGFPDGCSVKDVSLMDPSGRHPNHPHVLVTMGGMNPLQQAISELHVHGLSLPEQQYRDVFAVAARAVHHLHSKGVVHLNVGAESLVQCPDGTYKLTNFFKAHWLTEEISPPGFTVTPCCAPELAQAVWWGQTSAVTCTMDVWGMGCLLYAMMKGQTLLDTFLEMVPTGPDQPLHKQVLQRLAYLKQAQVTTAIDDLARTLPSHPLTLTALSLLRQMLSVDPAARPTAAQILRSKFLSDSSPVVRSTTYLPSTASTPKSGTNQASGSGRTTPSPDDDTVGRDYDADMDNLGDDRHFERDSSSGRKYTDRGMGGRESRESADSRGGLGNGGSIAVGFAPAAGLGRDACGVNISDVPEKLQQQFKVAAARALGVKQRLMLTGTQLQRPCAYMLTPEVSAEDMWSLCMYDPQSKPALSLIHWLRLLGAAFSGAADMKDTCLQHPCLRLRMVCEFCCEPQGEGVPLEVLEGDVVAALPGVKVAVALLAAMNGADRLHGLMFPNFPDLPPQLSRKMHNLLLLSQSGPFETPHNPAAPPVHPPTPLASTPSEALSHLQDLLNKYRSAYSCGGLIPVHMDPNQPVTRDRAPPLPEDEPNDAASTSDSANTEEEDNAMGCAAPLACRAIKRTSATVVVCPVGERGGGIKPAGRGDGKVGQDATHVVWVCPKCVARGPEEPKNRGMNMQELKHHLEQQQVVRQQRADEVQMQPQLEHWDHTMPERPFKGALTWCFGGAAMVHSHRIVPEM